MLQASIHPMTMARLSIYCTACRTKARVEAHQGAPLRHPVRALYRGPEQARVVAGSMCLCAMLEAVRCHVYLASVLDAVRAALVMCLSYQQQGASAGGRGAGMAAGVG